MTRKQLLQYSLLIIVPVLIVFIIDRSWPVALVLVSALGLNLYTLELFRREDVDVAKMRQELNELQAKMNGFTAMLSMRQAL